MAKRHQDYEVPQRHTKIERQIRFVETHMPVLPTSQGEAAVGGDRILHFFQSLPHESEQRRAATARRMAEAAKNKLRKNRRREYIGPSANHTIRAEGDQRNEF